MLFFFGWDWATCTRGIYNIPWLLAQFPLVCGKNVRIPFKRRDLCQSGNVHNGRTIPFAMRDFPKCSLWCFSNHLSLPELINWLLGGQVWEDPESWLVVGLNLNPWGGWVGLWCCSSDLESVGLVDSLGLLAQPSNTLFGTSACRTFCEWVVWGWYDGGIIIPLLVLVKEFGNVLELEGNLVVKLEDGCEVVTAK